MIDPYSIWKEFWPDEIMEGIVQTTNAYYQKKLEALRVNVWQQRQWKPLTMSSLQIWLGLLIKMQIDRKSKLAYYWRAPVGPAESASNFGNYMSRDVSHFSPKFECEST
jgi:hypothetical protein